MNIRKYIFWQVFLLFTFGLAFNSSGAVLCVEESGHFKVESVCEPCGDDKTSNLLHQPRYASDDYNHTGCSNCTDMLLNQHLYSHRHNRVSKDVIPSSIDAYSSPTFKGDIKIAPAVLFPLKRDSGYPLSQVLLASTVLLR